MASHAQEQQRVAEQYQQVSALFQELPSLWMSSAEIAACVGVPAKVAAGIACRLASEGAVEQRTVFWTSARSRRRDRYEFCFMPTGGHNWRQRLPEWLEPSVHPINPAHCRRVTGRASQSIAQDQTPMTEQEYRELPRHIRERFGAIADDTFDKHPSVVAARKRIEQAEAAHRAACEQAHQLRTRRVQLESFAETCRVKRREFQESRLQMAVDALVVSGTDVLIAVDDTVRDQIERFDMLGEAVPLALGQIDAQLVQLNRRIHTAANDSQNADEHLRGVLDRLKLEEAQRQGA